MLPPGPDAASGRRQGSRMVRFGPAGWDYPDWAGIVCPDPAPRGFDRLAFLARYFATIEVDATFYRPFPSEVAARWCERVVGVDGFRFGAEVWRRFTPEREPTGARRSTRRGRRSTGSSARAGPEPRYSSSPGRSGATGPPRNLRGIPLGWRVCG
jgi:hypothetical protein